MRIFNGLLRAAVDAGFIFEVVVEIERRCELSVVLKLCRSEGKSISGGSDLLTCFVVTIGSKLCSRGTFLDICLRLSLKAFESFTICLLRYYSMSVLKVLSAILLSIMPTTSGLTEMILVRFGALFRKYSV